jgi:hypothetical protein
MLLVLPRTSSFVILVQNINRSIDGNIILKWIIKFKV